ncbi:hypothetical protein SAMN05518672_1011379 [Chitinophaga sp. CF118]|uniref:hypothetical protein n=1 Tax=Chitinophaga sp. CF118 TaxID=1884367 RepID=UPI0008DFB976|nr:hypothetical protein [Chitinophaga sp. CF118]SFD27048.1 hypothetical protein SAMN05518672_1011379 [Chitinophaga sp. CF118]
MSNLINHIKLKAELSQSKEFGSAYEKVLQGGDSKSFSSPIIDDVSGLLNYILIKYDGLTGFQKNMLANIFDEFQNVHKTIDPKRLRSFEHYFNDDNELLLFRETENGLINIIINPDECAAFSFIPNNSEEQRQLYFIYPEGDFETLTYNFFSH